MVRDVIGGVTRSKLADRADRDEDFIKSSDDEPSALATIGIDATAIWDAVGAESTANGVVVEKAEWVKHAKELQATAVKALAAAKAHDKDGLLDVGEAIDSACESCHVVYWYPDEKKPK